MKVYAYCVMYSIGNLQTYRNGFFEAEKITSANMANMINEKIKESLNTNTNNFVLISLTVVGKVKD